MPFATLVCERCSGEFALKRSAVAKGKGRYCSIPCRRTPRLNIACKECGKEFLTLPGRIAGGRGSYCSKACHNAAMLLTDAEQLIRQVERPSDDSACWPWIGAKTREGYGRFGKRLQAAHRAAWEQASGLTIPAGMIVGHVCDNPPCTRNDEPGIYVVRGVALPRFGHLFLGTPGQNAADRDDKGRYWNPRWERGRYQDSRGAVPPVPFSVRREDVA